jgi:RHS repeat-associated protein
LNGNLLSDGTRVFEYDDENQLTAVTVSNSFRSEFVYDGKMRRRIRREYVWGSSAWNLKSEIHYIYDGNLVIQERDANNLPLVSYTRGRDLSGTLEGAGGIGGLLARTDHALLTTGNPGPHAYYHSDGNGNITALINTNQLIVARYLCDPFGNILSQSGPLADANLYRFSSREAHDVSGILYFGRRFYDPSLQRWLNRDPIAEHGGLNLYRYTVNAPVNLVDPSGLDFHTMGASGILYSGPFAYLSGDTTLENLAAGAYNTIPEAGNMLSTAGQGIASLLGLLGEGIDAAGKFAFGADSWMALGPAGADLDGAADAMIMLGSLTKVQCLAKTTSTAARTFTSTDPLVGNLANKIEALYPGHVIGVNVPLYDGAGTLLTDADILLQNAVIQVKSGDSAQRLLIQLERSEAATGLTSIGFGPNLPPNSLRTLSQQGGLVTGDENLLLELVKP